MKSRWRYLFPNLITAASMTCGMIAVERSIGGRFWSAAWWALYSTITDRLDGLTARKLNASSAFGMQLDSLADFLSFGVAPATLVYAFFLARPELGWATGGWAWALRGICVGYALCAASRLARFNVIATGTDKLFFGFPTTFTWATLGALFLMLLKYGDPSWLGGNPTPWDPRLLGQARMDGVMRVFPALLALGGLGMVSHVKVPKLGHRLGVLPLDIYMFVSVVGIQIACLGRMLPEYLAATGLTFVIGAFVYHFASPDARGAKLPPLFT